MTRGTTGTREDVNKAIFNLIFDNPVIAEQLSKEGLEILKYSDAFLVRNSSNSCVFFTVSTCRRGEEIDRINAILPGFIRKSQQGWDVSPM